jgi:hypothetical protein
MKYVMYVALAAAAAGVGYSLGPDFLRYLKIKSM